jgi:hypothetical protein
MDLFQSSGKGRETPTLLSTLEKANLKKWLCTILDDGQSPGTSDSTHYSVSTLSS